MSKFLKTIPKPLLISLLLLVGVSFYSSSMRKERMTQQENISSVKAAVVTREPTLSEFGFNDYFSSTSTIEEVGRMSDSKSPYWWVNSGAFLFQKGGVAKTIHGELTKDSKWQIKYYNYNASETDDGYHPQNIFRLITRSKWLNFQQEATFQINKYILSADEHRSESNGILLFNRYQDGNNLYYTGLRVDGAAVIKKKINGNYFTMAYNKIATSTVYNRDTNPNLLPIKQKIKLRSELVNLDSTRVSIKLFIMMPGETTWKLAAETIDDGKKYGGASIMTTGYAGIRTDFMDAEFDNYRITKK